MGHLWDRFRWTILFPAISFPPNSHVRSGPCASPRVACEVVHLSHGTRDTGSRPDPRGAVVCEASAAYPHAMAIALRSHGLLIARKVGEPKQDSANRSCHYTNPNRNLSIPTLLGGTRSRHRKSSAPLVVHCMGVSHVSQWDHLWDSLEGPSFLRPSPFRQIRICDQGLARRLAWRARLSICPVSPGH